MYPVCTLRFARSASSAYPTVRLRGPPSRALSGQPFRRFVTNRCEKCGIALLTRTYGLESTLLSVSFYDVHTQAAVQGTMR